MMEKFIGENFSINYVIKNLKIEDNMKRQKILFGLRRSS